MSKSKGNSFNLLSDCEIVDAIHETPIRELTFGIIFAGIGTTSVIFGIALIIESVKEK